MYKKEIVDAIIVSSLLIAIFIFAILAFIIQYRKRKLQHNKETKLMEQLHQQELLSTQLEMQTQTMQHIGREIHDNVGQKLTLASLYTQQLAYENKAPHINDKIENIGFIINESLAELRQLSKSLTDDSIKSNDIVDLLEEECEKVNHLKKCIIIFTCEQNKIDLNYQQKSILLRIVQEFLQNSIKHAQCKNIKVLLQSNDSFVKLFLEDNGNGFDTSISNNKGIGLSNMKKRAEMIGGTFALESKLAYGTKLTIAIPNDK
jgi:signal transduction histidine kinase